jgi:hypothetical protein
MIWSGFCINFASYLLFRSVTDLQFLQVLHGFYKYVQANQMVQHSCRLLCMVFIKISAS